MVGFGQIAANSAVLQGMFRVRAGATYANSVSVRNLSIGEYRRYGTKTWSKIDADAKIRACSWLRPPITSDRDSPIAAMSAAILNVFAATRRNTSASTSQRGASSITLAARPLPVTLPISELTN